MHALFYQYRVLPSCDNQLFGKISGGLASVIVFADSDKIGRARSVRFIAKQQWEVKEFVKVMFMGERQVENLDLELSKVYKEAEKFGIAAYVDTWSVASRR